jgi:hemerythrin
MVMTPTVSRSPLPLIRARDALGHAVIDADHAAIGDAWLAAMQCDLIALPFHVARLTKLMRTHFDHETELVEAVGVPFCWCHHNEHEAMLAICGEALSLSERDPRKARRLLRSQLSRRIRQHVGTMDQVAVLIINTAAPACAIGHAKS